MGWHSKGIQQTKAFSNEVLLTPMDVWSPVQLEDILRYFFESQTYEKVGEFFEESRDITPTERALIVFLNTVYNDSLATIHIYARYIVALINYGQKEFHQITAQDVHGFIRHQQGKGHKPATINTIIGAIKSFFRHLVDAGIIIKNPAAFLKNKKAGKQSLPGHLSHSLSESDLMRLFKGLESCGASLRDQALFRVLFLTGIRAEEAVLLKWGDVIQWQNKWYLDVLGKGSKMRRVYIPQQALNTMTAYGESIQALHQGQILTAEKPLFANERKPNEHISRHGLYVLVKKWCLRILGRRDVSPHWFRHSCFTQLAHKGASLESIKTLAGHESIETTMHYNEAAQLMEPAGVFFEKE